MFIHTTGAKLQGNPMIFNTLVPKQRNVLQTLQETWYDDPVARAMHVECLQAIHEKWLLMFRSYDRQVVLDDEQQDADRTRCLVEFFSLLVNSTVVRLMALHIARTFEDAPSTTGGLLEEWRSVLVSMNFNDFRQFGIAIRELGERPFHQPQLEKERENAILRMFMDDDLNLDLSLLKLYIFIREFDVLSPDSCDRAKLSSFVQALTGLRAVLE